MIVEADNILLNVIEARKHYPAKLKRLSSEEFVAQERRIVSMKMNLSREHSTTDQSVLRFEDIDFERNVYANSLWSHAMSIDSTVFY